MSRARASSTHALEVPTSPIIPALDSLALWMRVFEVVTPALVYMTVRTLRLRRFHLPVAREKYVPYVLVSGLWMILVRSIHAPQGPYIEFLGGLEAPLFDKVFVLTMYMVVPGVFSWIKTRRDLKGNHTPYDDGWEAFFQEHVDEGLYVRMTMKSGDVYAGFMGEGSCYSPESKTLYFSEVCVIDAQGAILQQVGTVGFMVACVDLRHIQFINPSRENSNVEARKTERSQSIRGRRKQGCRKYIW